LSHFVTGPYCFPRLCPRIHVEKSKPKDGTMLSLSHVNVPRV
jgi:hypothetical protein